MNIAEAIASLEDAWVDDPHFDPERRRVAINLGIKALKFTLALSQEAQKAIYGELKGGN